MDIPKESRPSASPFEQDDSGNKSSKRRRTVASRPWTEREDVKTGIVRIIRNSEVELSVRDIVRKVREAGIASSPNLILQELNRLHDEGMIEPSLIARGRGPMRKVYRPAQQIAPSGPLKDEFIELIKSDRLLQYFPKEMSPELWKRLVVLLGKFVSIGERPASHIAEQTYEVSKKYWNEFRDEVVKDTLRSFFQFIATLAILQTSSTKKDRKVAIQSYYALFSRDFGQECQDAFRTSVEAILLNFFPEEVSAEWSDIDRKLIKDILKEKGKLGNYDLYEELKERRTKLLVEQTGKRSPKGLTGEKDFDPKMM